MQNTRTAPTGSGTHVQRAVEALPADIATATPPQVDEVIRSAEFEIRAAGDRIASIIDRIRYAVGQTRTTESVQRGGRRTRQDVWSGTVAEALTAAETQRDKVIGYGDTTLGDMLAGKADLETLIAELEALVAEGDAEYNRRGWTRYFLVDNSNGHVHRTRACRETYVTTQWVWPTPLSGATATEVVAAAGEFTCLTCFPEVRDGILEARGPIDIARFDSPDRAEERRQREEEKAAKRAEKIAKGITTDGSPLSVRFDGRTNKIATERAAELRYVDCSWDAVRTSRILADAAQNTNPNDAYVERIADEHREYVAAAETLADALARKRGQTANQVREALADKVARKIARETY